MAARKRGAIGQLPFLQSWHWCSLRLVVFDQLPTARTITLSGTKAAILVSADVEKWLWRVKQASLLPRTGSPLCHLCNRCGRLPGLQVAEPGWGPSGLSHSI